MKTFILPLSSYLKINQNKTMDEFVKLGVPKWEMLLHWFSMPTAYLEQLVAKVRGPSLTFLFDEFNKGNLNSTQFRTALRNKFSALANKTDLQIDAAWNAMCIVTPFTQAAFDEVQQLHDGKNINIVFTSNTNTLHHQAIVDAYGQKIPGDEVAFSYDAGFGKTGPQFLNDYLNLIKDIPDQEIFVVYTPPPALPYPKLGFLSWFAAPFATWAASNGQNYVSKLQNMATTGNFTLVPSQNTATQPNIAQTLSPYVEKEAVQEKKESIFEFKFDRKYTPKAAAISQTNPGQSLGQFTLDNPVYEEDGAGKNKLKTF